MAGDRLFCLSRCKARALARAAENSRSPAPLPFRPACGPARPLRRPWAPTGPQGRGRLMRNQEGETRHALSPLQAASAVTEAAEVSGPQLIPQPGPQGLAAKAPQIVVEIAMPGRERHRLDADGTGPGG